jgi:predicted membrane channel-forming protein YqfA (hemolysin III family)
MAAPPPDAGAWPSRQIRNTAGLAAWTAAWVATLALASFGPAALWSDEPAPTLLAIAFNVLVGIGMLLAHKRYLEALDELQRTIQLQAMAWSLGVGLVGGMALALLTRFDLLAFEAEIAHLVILQALVYVVATVGGMLRYR